MPQCSWRVASRSPTRWEVASLQSFQQRRDKALQLLQRKLALSLERMITDGSSVQESAKSRSWQHWIRTLTRSVELRGLRTSSGYSQPAQMEQWAFGRTSRLCYALLGGYTLVAHGVFAPRQEQNSSYSLVQNHEPDAWQLVAPYLEATEDQFKSFGVFPRCSTVQYCSWSLAWCCFLEAVLGSRSQSPVRDATWSPDSQLILAGSLDGSARVWRCLGNSWHETRGLVTKRPLVLSYC